MNARRAWLACTGLLGCGITVATPVASKRQYLVSAVLRKDTQGYTILLVHGRQPATGKDEALGLFVQLTQEQYPDYSVMSTLVSEFDLTQPTCSSNRPFI